MTPAPKIVVVLSNWMDADGILNAESKGRAQRAAEKYAEDHDLVLTIGWNCIPRRGELFIADVMKDYIAALGVPADRILSERNSKDTVGDAVYSRRRLDSLFDDYTLCVVTSDYHLYRAMKIFRAVYGPDRPIRGDFAETRDEDDKLPSERESLRVFNAMFGTVPPGDLAGIQAVMQRHHPFYNGERHPAIRFADPA